MSEEKITETQIGLPDRKSMEMLVASFFPNARFFEDKFGILQIQIDTLKLGQEDLKERIKDLEFRFDRRFEQVDKRFEQVDKRIDEVRMDFNQRFEQVDKRFEQMGKSIEKLDSRLDSIAGSIKDLAVNLDRRDERQRAFTIRMFSIAVMISILGVLGMLFKILGVV